MNRLKFQHGFHYKETDGVGYYVIPSFEETGLVKHGFSSRIGGISTGECESLNLSFKRKDSSKNVLHNYKRMCDCIGAEYDNMVLSDQVHDVRIYEVTDCDKGKGFWKKSDICGIDGLITKDAGIPLVTLYADCVPLFFLDPVHKAIGSVHAGWRGTVKGIGVKALQEMVRRFGTDPEDCLIGIGPSIGPCCFEVDFPVKDSFDKAALQEAVISHEKSSKYHIDLWQANALQLIKAGIKAQNITIAEACTKCDAKHFYSHRRDQGQTGSLAAIIQLKE